MEKLNFEPSLDASNTTISIQGDNDVVVLGGAVNSFAKKLATEKAVKSLANVIDVANKIEVDLSIGYHKTEVERVKEVIHALKNIQSIVEKVIVTLTGEVDWYYQKNSAFKAICGLCGYKTR